MHKEMEKKAKVIAYHLPQYHPIKENDEWWGKGFTEWTNVAKAKPLFRGHHQPKIPADLGFYDLRLPVSRAEQAQLAKEAGVDAFCYWHYWFGNGKQLLEKPVEEILRLKEPDFPFCLAWANHSWSKKGWNSDVSRFCQELLLEQTYPGDDDIIEHFNKMLPAFKDDRYFTINNKLVFVIYDLFAHPDIYNFITIWRKLAKQEGIKDFYFIAHISREQDIKKVDMGYFDAINYHNLDTCFRNTRARRLLAYIIKRPIIKNYKRAMAKLRQKNSELIKQEHIYPTIYPNWDCTARRVYIGKVLKDSTPELFAEHVNGVIGDIAHKQKVNQVIFLKSWNEWAEGNYMEPDIKFGKGYIKALKNAVDSNK